MSYINIKLSETLNDSSNIRSRTITLDNVSSRIRGAQGSIDGDVFSEDGSIDFRINNCLSRLTAVKGRINNLSDFINESVDSYTAAEHKINFKINNI